MTVRNKLKKETALIALIEDVRLLFHRLAAIADDLHDEIGVTAAMRAVIETLSRYGPQTVPQIAEQKSVSRQHIQTIVNQLSSAGLVVLEANPNHKRSQLVRISAKGAKAYRAIRTKETPLLSSLAEGVTEGEIASARSVIAKMMAAMK